MSERARSAIEGLAVTYELNGLNGIAKEIREYLAPAHESFDAGSVKHVDYYDCLACDLTECLSGCTGKCKSPSAAAPSLTTDAGAVLTDEQILEMWGESFFDGTYHNERLLAFARALLAAPTLTDEQRATLLACALRFEAEGNKPMAADIRALLAAR